MEFIKQHRLMSIIVGGVILIILAFVVLFTILSFTTATETEPITFQEKYTQIEGKINNLVVEEPVREGFKVDLLTYTDKVKQDYDMSVDDKDKFMTFARTIDKESVQSKMHVLAFYGKVKKQFDTDVANIFLTRKQSLVLTGFLMNIIHYLKRRSIRRHIERLMRLVDVCRLRLMRRVK